MLSGYPVVGRHAVLPCSVSYSHSWRETSPDSELRSRAAAHSPSHRRRIALLVSVVVAFAWACTDQSDQARVEAALRHYSELVLAMDHARIAALFEPEGEIVNKGQAAVHGRAAIESFLSGFSGYHVLENNMRPASTVVRGNTAEQVGTYNQRVRTPDGEVLEVSGGFEAVWGRTSTGDWLIRRLGTSPSR